MKETEVNVSQDVSKWSKFDTNWLIGLFGTAIGAGILFLPIRAGTNGFWPLIIMTILILPMTYLSHRGLARFVTSAKNKGDITEIVEDGFGKVTGVIITVLYFLAIYPICLAYGVGITNTVDSFMVNQLGMAQLPRWLLAFVLITLMMIVMIKGKDFMLKATSLVTYPLIGCLFVLSLYLIPSWRFDTISLSTIPSFSDMITVVYLTIPVLVFAFNHSPAISQFAVSTKEQYKDNAEIKGDQILFRTAIVITIFCMLFVFSCVLTLTPAQLLEAKAQNIPILSYLSNISGGNKFLMFVGPLIAFCAIVSSFFGHYLGAHEGLVSIVAKQAKSGNKTPNMKKISNWCAAFIYVTMIIVAVINPSILGFIEDIGGPIIAIILFLMPMYAILKVPAMQKYASSKLSNAFVTIMGIIAVSGIIYKLLSSMF